MADEIPLIEILFLAICCAVGTGAGAYWTLKRLIATQRRSQLDGDVELQALHRDEDYEFEGQGSTGDVYLPQGL